MKLHPVIDKLTYGVFRNQVPVKYTTQSNSLGFGGSMRGPLDSMGSVGTLYAIIDLLATSVSRVDWALYRKSVDQRRVYGPMEDNRREVTTHPALNLLNNPNPYMTRNELIERTEQSIDLVGESFWVVNVTGTTPIEIWPVRADRMEEVIGETGQLIGWKYREPNGQYTPFQLREVIHIQRPDPGNPHRGISPVRALAIDLAATEAAGKFNLNFFRNSARPGGIIEVPSMLSDTEFDRLALQWREQHAGVNNAHRVGILENGAKWVEAAYNMVDMQFVELRNVSRELIREAYRIHSHMLGQSDDVNRANALAASADFATWQVIPRLERIQQALNGPYLSLFGELGSNVVFCHEEAVPHDPEQEIAERDSNVKNAVALIREGFDPTETLAAFGLPELNQTQKPEPSQTLPGVTDAQLRAILNMKANL